MSGTSSSSRLCSGSDSSKDQARIHLRTLAELTGKLFTELNSIANDKSSGRQRPLEVVSQIVETDRQLQSCVAQLEEQQRFRQSIVKMRRDLEHKQRTISCLVQSLHQVEKTLQAGAEKHQIAQPELGAQLEVPSLINYAQRASYSTAAAPRWVSGAALGSSKPPAPTTEDLRLALTMTSSASADAAAQCPASSSVKLELQSSLTLRSAAAKSAMALPAVCQADGSQLPADSTGFGIGRRRPPDYPAVYAAALPLDWRPGMLLEIPPMPPDWLADDMEAKSEAKSDESPRLQNGIVRSRPVEDGTDQQPAHKKQKHEHSSTSSSAQTSMENGGTARHS